MKSSKRILIVDDSPRYCATLRMLLEELGDYEVRTEMRSAFALETAHEFRPHMVLLDVDMPDLNGGEMAALLRADPRFSDVPLLFVTGLAQRPFTQANGQRFLPKTLSPDLLLAEVRDAIGSALPDFATATKLGESSS